MVWRRSTVYWIQSTANRFEPDGILRSLFFIGLGVCPAAGVAGAGGGGGTGGAGRLGGGGAGGIGGSGGERFPALREATPMPRRTAEELGIENAIPSDSKLSMI